MKRKLLAILLCALLLCTMLPLGAVSAGAEEEQNLEEVFRDELDRFDYSYDGKLTIHAMQDIVCEVLYSWDEAQANDFADILVPAEEFEAELYRRFAPTDEQLFEIRNDSAYDYVLDRPCTFYDEETDSYRVYYVGGRGGSNRERQYSGYVKTETGYTVYYATIDYDYLTLSDEKMGALREQGWPNYIYDGVEYEYNGYYGYYQRIGSVDNYGSQYDVQYNDGILRILSVTPYSDAPDLAITSNGLKYLVENGAATIVGYTDELPENVIVPDTIEGCPVTTIGNGAFYECSFLCTIEFPDNITKIGSRAFYECKGLSAVAIPDSVDFIGDYAFYGCFDLTSVTLPKGLSYLGEYVFFECCQLVSVTMPDHLAVIGHYAFGSCDMLVELTMPSSVAVIGKNAFQYCYNLSDIWYAGTEADREKLAILDQNAPLLDATWHYNYTPDLVVILGDANGDDKVNNRDLGTLQRYLNDYEVVVSLAACDVTGDGKINNRDLGLLQQYLNGWGVELG